MLIELFTIVREELVRRILFIGSFLICSLSFAMHGWAECLISETSETLSAWTGCMTTPVSTVDFQQRQASISSLMQK